MGAEIHSFYNSRGNCIVRFFALSMLQILRSITIITNTTQHVISSEPLTAYLAFNADFHSEPDILMFLTFLRHESQYCLVDCFVSNLTPQRLHFILYIFLPQFAPCGSRGEKDAAFWLLFCAASIHHPHEAKRQIRPQFRQDKPLGTCLFSRLGLIASFCT